MKPWIIFASLALAVTLATPAAATTVTRLHARHPVAQQQAPQHIACTTAGCIAVPRHCGQEDGITPGGLPTGYDVIVCPAGVWPQF